jgi:hypothetical protein
MRDYAKVSPRFWTGETGQALARRGSEALVVAVYLMTSPHSNMLGLYYQPVLYMAEETGLSPEGASKGLEACIEEGFCRYDHATKMVWVIEMASYQIGSTLDAKDKRCIGIQKDYMALPNCPFLPAFFDHYVEAYHLTERREFVVKQKVHALNGASPSEAPSKPGEGTGAGAGSGKGAGRPSASSPGKPTTPHQAIVDLYHEVLPEMPRCRLLPESRKRALAKTWAWVLSSTKGDGSRRAETPEQALAWFRDYFTRARDNDFLMGRGQRSAEHAKWQCDLDFLLTDKGMKHVIEKTAVPTAEATE